MGHTLTDNRHGPIVNAMVRKADGLAEREAAKVMINDARQATADPDRIKKVDQLFVLTMAAYNLVRMRSLGEIGKQTPHDQSKR